MKSEIKVLQVFYKLSGHSGEIRLTEAEKAATAKLLEHHPVDEVVAALRYVFVDDKSKYWVSAIVSPADLERHWDTINKRVKGNRQLLRVLEKDKKPVVESKSTYLYVREGGLMYQFNSAEITMSNVFASRCQHTTEKRDAVGKSIRISNDGGGCHKDCVGYCFRPIVIRGTTADGFAPGYLLDLRKRFEAYYPKCVYCNTKRFVPLHMEIDGSVFDSIKECDKCEEEYANFIAGKPSAERDIEAITP